VSAAAEVPVVVVTGASAGVGRATARAFGRLGARVALLARGRDGLEAARGEIEAAGGRALVLPVDVARADDVDAAAGAAERELGPIDVWINNAMVSVFSPIAEMRPEEFHRVTAVTYLGVVHGTLAALRRMRPRGRGTIVQVGSALAYRSIPLQSAYCGAKHAIAGFTDALRCELIHERSRIRVTMVHLPALNTPQFSWSRTRMPRRPQPVPPIFQPEVAAEAIVFAAHHPRRELWVGWPTAAAILGQRLAPGLLDHYLGRTGYASQQYDGAPAPDRRDNLEAALPGDHGAHGEFDARAHRRSPALRLAMHRVWMGVAALAGAAALTVGGRLAGRGAPPRR
jgi:NAD(P)-dependent dehydrogenase (short-subunit alcohol dehydrogenase family)